MKHPELFAVPVLMLADYLLTILGAKYSRTVYRNHFSTPTYELNPIWRKNVDQIQWFNPRHLALVALITVGLIAIDQNDVLAPAIPVDFPFDLFKCALGMLFGAFGSVCGRHLTNLLLFCYLNRHPQEISGQVQMSMVLILKISQFSCVGLLPLFGILAVLVPHPYTLGTLLGLVTLVLVHILWINHASATKPDSGQTAPAQQAS